MMVFTVLKFTKLVHSCLNLSVYRRMQLVAILIMLHAFRKIQKSIAPRETSREGQRAKPEVSPGRTPEAQ